MKILLTGANGQLGRCLQDRFPSDWNIVATDSCKLDISNLKQVQQFIIQEQPDAIINAAAYTAVDKAEQETLLAQQINELGPLYLAEQASLLDIPFIHVSTDYVFNGDANQPYLETDAVDPKSIYGKTKLAGEKSVIKTYPNAIIVRTAWVFSEYGNNFLKTMLRLGKERDEISIVSDQIGSPTYAGEIANAIIKLLVNQKEKENVYGIYHFTGQTVMSWFDFSTLIFAQAFKNGLITKIPKLNPIPTSKYPTPAKRPEYSVLCCDKIEPIYQHSDLIKSIDFVLQHLR